MLELTQEEIVTEILLSNGIIKDTDKKSYITSAGNDLSKFLSNIPKEENDLIDKPAKNSKYTFIQDNLWKF